MPGYPVRIWRLRPGADYDRTSEIHRVLLENSVDLNGNDWQSLRGAAERGVVVVIG